jgi:hypothetical protein
MSPLSRGLHIAVVAFAITALACGDGGSPVAPTPPPTTTPAPGRLNISDLTATGQGAPGAITYKVSMRLTETGGRAVTLNTLTVRLDAGRVATVSGNNSRVAANGSTNVGPLTITRFGRAIDLNSSRAQHRLYR